MTRLLVYEPAWRRIEARIAARGDSVEALVMDPAGRLTLGAEEVSADDAAPDAAWASGEVYLGPVAREFMTAMLKAPQLAWVQSAAAGFDHPVFAAIAAKGARLTTSHVHAEVIADYVLAGVLDHFQAGPARRAAQAEGVWRRVASREVAGSTWLIIGFGAIGQAVALRARAFGARIVGVRRDRSPHPAADAITGLDALAEHLPGADVVVLCAPLNLVTRRVANGEAFRAMRAGAVLVNVGRGGLVNEPDLLAALDRGAPGHAILDVFETEPLPLESPFWTHPRVSLTAHSSSETTGVDARNQALFLANLERWLAGEALINEVDPADVLAGAN